MVRAFIDDGPDGLLDGRITNEIRKITEAEEEFLLDCAAKSPAEFACRHRLGYSPNLLLDADAPTTSNQVRVGDITYIPLKGGTFCYLASLMDRFSRRIVGWQLGDDMAESLVLAALRSAIKERQPRAKLIHHTDRGGQYAGNRYRSVLHRAEILQSMSRPDNCYDNVFMESCFGTIKTELEMIEYEESRQA